MTTAWVVGCGGLLGTALCRVLRGRGTKLYFPDGRFSWTNASEFAPQLEAAVRGFAAGVGTTERWEVYWAAGVGTMGSSNSDLEVETRFLALLLQLFESDSRLISAPGAIAFASSAGAIYAGSSDYIISEETPIAPTTAYGRAKLQQENLLRNFAQKNGRIAVSIARLSTLYGPGQSLGKQQGLLAHIARCMLRNRPVQVYVPLDTIRDYIAADDAAAAIVAVSRVTAEERRVLTKIIASEEPATIAEIISAFRRVARRAPRVVTSASKLTGIYSRRVQFRSVVAPTLPRSPRTSLLVGISQVMAAEHREFVRSPRGG